jgi:hypothetical protein
MKTGKDEMTAEEEFAKELAKQLPVKAIYEDAAAPAAKQTGQLLQDLVKALQLALAPVQLLGAIQDRYRRFLDAAVRRVPEANRISPSPQIIGPVLEGVRYEPEGTPIDEMFSQLLSASMDTERVRDAHPSFPLLVRQLSADEAKLLNAVFLAPKPLRLVQTFRLAGGLSFSGDTEIDELSSTDGLVFPANVAMYRDHMQQLGLLHYSVERPMEPIRTGSVQTGGRNFLEYRLTEFGLRFMRACSVASRAKSTPQARP